MCTLQAYSLFNESVTMRSLRTISRMTSMPTQPSPVDRKRLNHKHVSALYVLLEYMNMARDFFKEINDFRQEKIFQL